MKQIIKCPSVSGGRGMTLECPHFRALWGLFMDKANIDPPTGSRDSGNGGTCLQF